MDWDEIIERNTERLLAVIAQLFFRSGLDEGGAEFLPRRAWRALLILLRPAESAVRRLIVIAARGIVVKLRAGRGFPIGLKLRLMKSAEKDADRIPAFLLIDPLKRFAPADFEWSNEWGKDW